MAGGKGKSTKSNQGQANHGPGLNAQSLDGNDIVILNRASYFLTPDAAENLRALNPGDKGLKQIAKSITRYQQFAGQESEDQHFQDSFAVLQELERAIYGWFKAQAKTHQALRSVPHLSALQELRHLVEEERESLVDRAFPRVGVLPFDITGMNPGEIAQATALWQSLCAGQGNVQILGSPGHQRRIRSELARILSTPTGRQLMGFLNVPNAGLVPGSTDAELGRIYIGESTQQLPEAVQTGSPLLADENRSEAQPLGLQNHSDDLTEAEVSDIDPSSPPDPADFPAISRNTIHLVRATVLGGGRGYTHAGKKYEFTKPGTGSFVKSLPENAIMGNKLGNQIIAPSWVTLGHELGHSANMKAAASQIRRKAHFDDPLVTGLAGGSEKGKKWTNAEELLNIRNIENALRRESGLSFRVGHQPPAWVQARAVEVRKELCAPLLALLGGDAKWYKFHEWKVLEKRFRTLPAIQCADPSVVADSERQLAEFLHRHTVLREGVRVGNIDFQIWKQFSEIAQ